MAKQSIAVARQVGAPICGGTAERGEAKAGAMAGTAAALGCAAPTREGKAMGRPAIAMDRVATAGESTDKGGDGRAEQGIAAAWLGTAPRGKCMVGKATAKIGIARAEDCVGQLRRCKARRWLAAAEHRTHRRAAAKHSYAAAERGAALTRISMALSARRWRRFGVQGHSQTAMCSGIAIQCDGFARRRRHGKGIGKRCKATARHSEGPHGRGSAWHWQARAKHTIGGRRHSYARHGKGEARRCVGCVAEALHCGAAAWRWRARPCGGRASTGKAMARSSRAEARHRTAKAQNSDVTLGQGRASRAALGHGGARPVQVCIGNRKSRR